MYVYWGCICTTQNVFILTMQKKYTQCWNFKKYIFHKNYKNLTVEKKGILFINKYKSKVSKILNKQNYDLLTCWRELLPVGGCNISKVKKKIFIYLFSSEFNSLLNIFFVFNTYLSSMSRNNLNDLCHCQICWCLFLLQFLLFLL